MSSDQYTVLLDSRPVRVAFLVDVDKFPPGSDRLLEIVEAAVNFNTIQWGGRTNTITFFSGGSFDENQWRLIAAADPDRVVAFAPLSQQLLRELDDRLDPCRIEIDDQTQKEDKAIALRIDGGIGMPPTKDNFRHLGVGGKTKLLLFGFAENCDPVVQRFVRLNFGTYDQCIDPKSKAIRRTHRLEQILQEIETLNYTVTDIKSLADVLTQLSGRIRPHDCRPAHPFVAPYQLSSLFLDDWPSTELQSAYQIIVGDDPRDLSEHWNGALWKRNWATTHAHQLWVDKKLICDATFRAALYDWVTRYRKWEGGWRVELLSNSLSNDEVAQVLAEFQGTELALPFKYINPNEASERFAQIHDERKGHERFIPWTTDDDVLRFSASFPEDRLGLPYPEPLEGRQRNGSWMVDVQLEHRCAGRAAGREQAWWLLPRSKGARLARSIFRAPARINSQGRFSVEVESRDERLSRRVRPQLKVQLPTDAALLRAIVTPHRIPPYFQADPRTQLVAPRAVVAGCRVSTKGAYLAALLGLFGDFCTAESFCERRFWRGLFSELAGHGTGDDETLRLKLSELLSAHSPGNFAGEPQQLKLLSAKILHLVRGRLQGHYLSFNECLQLRGRLQKQPVAKPLLYPQGETIVHRQDMAPVSVPDLEKGLEVLLQLGILRLGIQNECPQCKVRSWYHVDDIAQQITCAGCGNVHALSARESWNYALNSLAQMSVSQGVLGVLHALTALESSTLHSFFAFSPSLDLFRSGDKRPWHEIDIACIADGEFVIGEVKEGFVQKTVFDELAEVSEALRPKRAIVFLPLERAVVQMSELQQWLNEIKTRLEPIGVSAEIFTLPEF